MSEYTGKYETQLDNVNDQIVADVFMFLATDNVNDQIVADVFMFLATSGESEDLDTDDFKNLLKFIKDAVAEKAKKVVKPKHSSPTSGQKIFSRLTANGNKIKEEDF